MTVTQTLAYLGGLFLIAVVMVLAGGLWRMRARYPRWDREQRMADEQETRPYDWERDERPLYNPTLARARRNAIRRLERRSRT